MGYPIDDGYHMPPEWAPHERCWMAWPSRSPTFPNLTASRNAYAVVARAIAHFEPVTMIANPENVPDAVKRCGETVEVLALEIDDAWTRDTGPTYLVDGRGGLGGVDWPFNNYGEIDPNYENDRLTARRLLEQSSARRFEAPITLEGGAIHTDGQGTLLTTESVVLNPNRNPGLTKTDADEIFRSHLGAEKVIWLDRALDVDTTDGHVDNLACFVRPGVVAALVAEDPADSQYAPLQENLERLRHAKDAAGRPLEIIEICQPGRREFQGERIPASYLNFYIANGGIVMPVFDDPADRAAIETLEQTFPDRIVVPVPGIEIVQSGGCIHCITQQEPQP
ncbi:MAG: agmatine deiminase family protein [Deltaproteobacteria bacterium]|nr:agmatine deiminase family protein [Deltaproteobacteria bacterium]MBW2293372.1 agmatine deiminase family protein [Deltaproteobacteria bacterium]MBW2391166.1 agmatine deiminase family protein [Deltaproteobacteria bacterium]